MENKDNSTAIFETEDGSARFYFSHSSTDFTTGILVLKPGAALPKHNRPHAIENLTQVAGKCLMTLFDEDGTSKEYALQPGEGVRMHEGQFHIHANPFEETSLTLFIAEGDIVDIVDQVRKTMKRVTTNTPKKIYNYVTTQRICDH